MPVPTYPSSIGASNIQTEFGGSNPIAISEYYSGGTYVPTGTANSTGTTIPTSGLIKYLNFSGSIKLTNIGWWQFRYKPNTSHYQFNSTDQSPGTIKFMRTTANTNTFSYLRHGAGSGMNTFISWISAETGASQDSKAILQYGSIIPSSVDFSNNDSHYITFSATTPTAHVVANVSPTGTVNWSTNSNSAIATLAAINGNVIVTGKSGSNCWIAKVDGIDGTTKHWKFSPCTTQAVVSTVGRGLFVTPNEQMAIWITGTTTGSIAIYQIFTGNGTIYSANNGTRTLGAMYSQGTNRTDPSGNISIRSGYSVTLRDFGTLQLARKPPTHGFLKSIPIGNTITCVAGDEAGNTYISYIDGISNTYLAKLDSVGNITWQRKLRSSRTDASGVFRPTVWRIVAKADQFLIYLNVTEMIFNTSWGEWNENGYPEIHLLRLPSDGANTGTYANLIYESTTAVSFTSQTNPTMTSTVLSTDYPFTPLLQANTLTLTTNTAKNIQGVAI